MTTLNAERVGRPVVHGLDVVAVRIEQEGGVIAGMVGPLAGRAVVAAAIGEPGPIDQPAAAKLPCIMNTPPRH
jgi:hypothetical protein